MGGLIVAIWLIGIPAAWKITAGPFYFATSWSPRWLTVTAWLPVLVVEVIVAGYSQLIDEARSNG